VSADLWLLNIELDISNHSEYIKEVERAAIQLQRKNSLYHTAVNAYDQSLDEHSQHLKYQNI
jgi:hypothetical protein